ncbi:hypothetical protein MMC30_004034 [Trapelia coarctata]|nr:hypothetical protein [Trapelia coarctata]
MDYELDINLWSQPNQFYGFPPSPLDSGYNHQEFLQFDTDPQFHGYKLKAIHPQHGSSTRIEVRTPSKTDPLPKEISESSKAKEKAVSALDRKRAQNRAAQRAYRERQERYLTELEDKVGEMKSACSNLSDLNAELMRQLQELTTEKQGLQASYWLLETNQLESPT